MSKPKCNIIIILMSDHIDFEIKILSCTDTCPSITYILLLFISLCTYFHECNSLRKRIPNILRQLNVIYTIIIFYIIQTFYYSYIHTVVGTASIKVITKCISHFCNMLLSLAGASLLGRHCMLILLLQSL